MSKLADMPAFPKVLPKDWKEADRGMTYRQWLAGKVLQGLCANPHADIMVYTGDTLIGEAVGIADKLISELEKQL